MRAIRFQNTNKELGILSFLFFSTHWHGNRILHVSFTLPINTYGDEDVPFCVKTDQCECADSSFCDPSHKHIITEDLQIIKTIN